MHFRLSVYLTVIMKFTVSLLVCECSYAPKNKGCRSGFLPILWVTQEILYAVLRVSIIRPKATHITATMTILPAETCSELVERNNVHVLDVAENLERNFKHKT